MQTLACRNRHAMAVAAGKGSVSRDHHRRRRRGLQSRRAQRLSESRWVGLSGCSPRRPSFSGRSRSAQGQGRPRWRVFAYVRDACVERALTCRSRSVLPRMLTRTCFALPGRFQEHPIDYSDQLLHPIARLGAHGAALKAVLKDIDRVRWPPPILSAVVSKFWVKSTLLSSGNPSALIFSAEIFLKQ